MLNSNIEVKTTFSLEVNRGHSTIGVNVLDKRSGKTGTYFLRHTNHSRTRSEQRGIDCMTIALVLEYGKLFQRQGLEFYAVGARGLPDGIDPKLKGKMKDTVVVIGRHGEIVTCYRGKSVIKHIQRKQKYLETGTQESDLGFLRNS